MLQSVASTSIPQCVLHRSPLAYSHAAGHDWICLATLTALWTAHVIASFAATAALPVAIIVTVQSAKDFSSTSQTCHASRWCAASFTKFLLVVVSAERRHWFTVDVVVSLFVLRNLNGSVFANP